jgi:hypothetical protein
MQVFKAIAQWFKNLFSSPQVKAFEEWCLEVFTAEKALVLAQLKAFAISAVATAEATGLDSDAKRKQAFSSITAQAQTAGIVCGASMIGLALEMALQALKNNSGNQGNLNG